MPCASNKKRHPLFSPAPCCLAGCRSRYCRRNYYRSLHPPSPSRPSKPICSLAKGNALSNCRKDKRIPISPGLEPYGNDRSPENTSPLHPWPFRMQSKEWRYLFYKKRRGSQSQSNVTVCSLEQSLTVALAGPQAVVSTASEALAFCER